MPESVPIKIGEYSFTFVRLAETDFTDVAAVYVVICVLGEKGNYGVIDVGQTGEVGTRINSHEREECWKRECSTGNIWVCVHTMPSVRYTKDDRLHLERDLRERYKHKCGEK
jgi:hypothetical protein